MEKTQLPEHWRLDKLGVNDPFDVDMRAAWLKVDYPMLSVFECLTLAQKDKELAILQSAFVVSGSDKHPSALEAIAMQLGYERGNDGLNTLSEGLSNIEDRLNQIRELLREMAVER